MDYCCSYLMAKCIQSRIPIMDLSLFSNYFVVDKRWPDRHSNTVTGTCFLSSLRAKFLHASRCFSTFCEVKLFTLSKKKLFPLSWVLITLINYKVFENVYSFSSKWQCVWYQLTKLIEIKGKNCVPILGASYYQLKWFSNCRVTSVLF